MTQESVAYKAGISRSFYSHIEKGEKNPSVKTAKAIARVVKVKWEIFFKEECPVKSHYDKEVG